MPFSHLFPCHTGKLRRVMTGGTTPWVQQERHPLLARSVLYVWGSIRFSLHSFFSFLFFLFFRLSLFSPVFCLLSFIACLSSPVFCRLSFVACHFFSLETRRPPRARSVWRVVQFSLLCVFRHWFFFSSSLFPHSPCPGGGNRRGCSERRKQGAHRERGCFL